MNFNYIKVSDNEFSLVMLIMGDTIKPYKLLSTTELQFYNKSCKTNKRKDEFYWGRIAMKMTLLSEKKRDLFQRLSIKKGIFNQPVVENNNIDFSISHCSNIVVATCFPKSYLVGIDIEKIKYDNLCYIENFYPKNKVPYGIKEEIACTISWTAAEAISKALKIGFTANPQIFCIKNISIKNDIFFIDFVNFPNFKGFSFKLDEYIFSIIVPKNVYIDICKIRKIINDWWNEYLNGKTNTEP